MKKISLVLLFVILFVTVFGATQAFAFEPYDTYTYSIDGEPLKSPAAYRAEEVIDSLKMGLSDIAPDNPTFSSASDITTDELGNIYIADRGNNRIVILDQYYQRKAILDSYVDEGGELQTFNQPRGVFVTNPNVSADKQSHIYICDTGNRCVVVFDREYNYVKTIKKPDTTLIKDAAFVPCAIAVDLYGRIFDPIHNP